MLQMRKLRQREMSWSYFGVHIPHHVPYCSLAHDSNRMTVTCTYNALDILQM